jgi:hypothetical protein
VRCVKVILELCRPNENISTVTETEIVEAQKHGRLKFVTGPNPNFNDNHLLYSENNIG